MNDSLLTNVISERNALRSQNEELWIANESLRSNVSKLEERVRELEVENQRLKQAAQSAPPVTDAFGGKNTIPNLQEEPKLEKKDENRKEGEKIARHEAPPDLSSTSSPVDESDNLPVDDLIKEMSQQLDSDMKSMSLEELNFNEPITFHPGQSTTPSLQRRRESKEKQRRGSQSSSVVVTPTTPTLKNIKTPTELMDEDDILRVMPKDGYSMKRRKSSVDTAIAVTERLAKPASNPKLNETNVPENPPAPVAQSDQKIEMSRQSAVLPRLMSTYMDKTQSPLASPGNAPTPPSKSPIQPPADVSKQLRFDDSQFESQNTLARREIAMVAEKQPAVPPDPRQITQYHRLQILKTVPSIKVSVMNTLNRMNEDGKDVIAYLISVRTNDAELWRIEKKYSDILQLHERLRRIQAFARRAPPEKQLFTFGKKDISPSKSDQRRLALEDYLMQMLDECRNINDPTELLTFLATHIYSAEARVDYLFNDSIREGYLTKRGKNFGGWKRRYVVLLPTGIQYYDSRDAATHFCDTPGNNRRSTFVARQSRVELMGARISKQKTNAAADPSDYRHALMITEVSEDGQPKRHILCAESDAERDDWVKAISRQVEILKMYPSGRLPPAVHTQNNSTPTLPSIAMPMNNMMGANSTTSLNNLRSNGAPPRQPTPPFQKSVAQQPSFNQPPQNQNNVSRPAFKQPPQSTIPKSSPTRPESTFFPTVAPLPSQHQQNQQQNDPQDMKSRASKVMSMLRPNRDSGVFAFPVTSSSSNANPLPLLFGAPLAKAVEYSRIPGGLELPSVITRCIEFLDEHGASVEEGIYRISGSNGTINDLRNAFEKHRDVNLLTRKPIPDIHDVAGLLKLYLRSLPDSILTQELHSKFYGVTDLIAREERLVALAKLISQLPLANYTLLRVVIGHLIKIVENADINKMTIRNIGIVFSPTLGIPAGIFTLLMTEFEFIFFVQNEKDQIRNSGPTSTNQQALTPLSTVTSKQEKRTSWRADEIPVDRSLRNSQLFMSHIPVPTKNTEQTILEKQPLSSVPSVEDNDSAEIDLGNLEPPAPLSISRPTSSMDIDQYHNNASDKDRRESKPIRDSRVFSLYDSYLQYDESNESEESGEERDDATSWISMSRGSLKNDSGSPVVESAMMKEAEMRMQSSQQEGASSPASLASPVPRRLRRDDSQSKRVSVAVFEVEEEEEEDSDVEVEYVQE